MERFTVFVLCLYMKCKINEKGLINMKNNKLLKTISLILTLAILLFTFVSCTEKDAGNVMSCKDEKGNITGSVDQKLLSLIIAVVNFQLGADSLEDDMWDMQYQEGNDTTVKDIVMAQSIAYAKGLLQAEYLCDNVYKIGLSDGQKDSVEKYISELSSSYGGQKNLENSLSVYGADVETLKRYMSLVLKQDTLYESFYAENGLRSEVVDQRKPSYFEENFVIADHILIKYSGGTKDDGTEIPLSDEEKSAKRDGARTLYDEIVNGVRGFDEALAEFNQDTYKLGYPFGYFVSEAFFWSGMSEDVQNAALEMNEGEIRFVDTADGAYIIRRNAMDSSLYASNGGFETYIESTIAQEDFLEVCEAASVEVNNELANELNPASIPSFNIDAL